jgi:hypothetical protein
VQRDMKVKMVINDNDDDEEETYDCWAYWAEPTALLLPIFWGAMPVKAEAEAARKAAAVNNFIVKLVCVLMIRNMEMIPM